MTDAVFERSAATVTLIDLLRKCKEGSLVTYEAMITATNRDIARRDRHLLVSALNFVRRNHSLVFGVVWRVGMQRLKPNELVKEGHRRIRAIGRQAGRGGVLMDTAAMERLTPDERLSHASTRGVLASIEESAREAVPKPERGRSNTDPVVRVVA